MWFDLSPWIERHGRAALSFSGGKDSAATLMMLKPWWDRITVYWSNPGAPLPATQELIKKVADMVPSFVEVRGNVLGDIAENGWPVDVTPHSMTWVGRWSSRTEGLIVRDRIDCCAKNLMIPVYERIVADGHTLLIRGQRDDEYLVNPDTTTGVVDEDGVTHLLPLEYRTSEQVTNYLQAVAPELLHPCYEFAKSSLDCACCTAYWGEGHSQYLAHAYPEAHENRQHIIASVLLECDRVRQEATN